MLVVAREEQNAEVAVVLEEELARLEEDLFALEKRVGKKRPAAPAPAPEEAKQEEPVEEESAEGETEPQELQAKQEAEEEKEPVQEEAAPETPGISATLSRDEVLEQIRAAKERIEKLEGEIEQAAEQERYDEAEQLSEEQEVEQAKLQDLA